MSFTSCVQKQLHALVQDSFWAAWLFRFASFAVLARHNPLEVARPLSLERIRSRVHFTFKKMKTHWQRGVGHAGMV